MNNVIYKLDEYLNYQKLIKDMVSSPRNEVIFNSSLPHAVMIQCGIVELAEKTGARNINVFCGKMSAFLSKTETKINEAFDSTKKEYDCENDQKWMNLHPYQDLLDSLISYFRNNQENTACFIIEEDSDLKNDAKLLTLLRPYIRNGQLRLFKAGDSFGYSHFMVAGNSYRLEESDEDKTAMCNFMDKDMSETLNMSFSLLSILATPMKVSA